MVLSVTLPCECGYPFLVLMTCLTVFCISSSTDWRLRGDPAGEQTGQLSADPQEKGLWRPILGVLWWVQPYWLVPWKGWKKKSESRFAWVLFPVCSRNVCIVKSWNIEACFSWRFLPVFPIWKTHTPYGNQYEFVPEVFLLMSHCTKLVNLWETVLCCF